MKSYRETIEKLSEKEIFDELIAHTIGDDWDGCRTNTCEQELIILNEVFKERMIKLGLNWEEN